MQRFSRRTLGALALSSLLPLSGCYQPPTMANRGGAVLVYRLTNPPKTKEELETSGMRAAVLKRLDPRRVYGVSVKILSHDQIEVSAPTHEDNPLARVKQLMGMQGALEFLIVANEIDHSDIIAMAGASSEESVMQGTLEVARWVDLSKPSVAGGISQDADQLRGDILRDGATGKRISLEEMAPGQTLANYLGEAGVHAPEVLVIVDKPGENVTGEDFVSVDARAGDTPTLDFALTESGSKRIHRLTSAHQPDIDDKVQHYRKLAIIFDGRVISAPRIQAPIGQRGRISGSFTEDEVRRMADVLRHGEFPFELESDIVSESNVGP